MRTNHNGSGSTNALLGAALDYAGRGWSIIPIGKGKRPTLRTWKPYQSARADEATIRAWFAKPRVRGVAVVLGAVSGGLACRDFDEAESYQRWEAEHPDEAKALPTARTARGFHVYFRHPGEVPPTRKLPDGELRGEGGYVIVPPSVHDTGAVYAWTVPLGSAIREVDPVAVGLAAESGQDEPTGKQGDRETGLAGQQGPTSNTLSGKSPATHPIPEVCFVTGPGQHDGATFTLARFVKHNLGLASPAEARPWYDEWYRKSVDGMSDPDPDEAWMKFRRGFAHARIPLGAHPAEIAMKNARLGPQPAEVENYRGAKTRMLVVLLYHLDRLAPGKPFVLSSHKAAALIGTDPGTAHCLLHGVAEDGVTECVNPGKAGRPGKNAARWRWIGSRDT